MRTEKGQAKQRYKGGIRSGQRQVGEQEGAQLPEDEARAVCRACILVSKASVAARPQRLGWSFLKGHPDHQVRELHLGITEL